MHEREMSKPFFLCLAATLCHNHLLAENFYEVARWRLYQIVNFWTLINFVLFVSENRHYVNKFLDSSPNALTGILKVF